MAVVCVCEADASGLDEETDFLSVRRLNSSRGGHGSAEGSRSLLAGEDGLIRRAIEQANATLVTCTDWPHGFKHHRLREVPWQRDTLANGKRRVGHLFGSFLGMRQIIFP